MESNAQIVGTKLFLDGFMYLKSKSSKGKVYWDYHLLRKKECTARAITADTEPGELVVLFKRPIQSSHAHIL